MMEPWDSNSDSVGADQSPYSLRLEQLGHYCATHSLVLLDFVPSLVDVTVAAVADERVSVRMRPSASLVIVTYHRSRLSSC